MATSERWPQRWIVLLVTALLASPGIAIAAEPQTPLIFPAGSGVLNVHDFGAKGDGKTDDTEAILKALAASGQSTGYSWFHDKIVYLPDGTYLISAPLLKRYANGSFASGVVLLGESRAHTVLKLADHAQGYANPKQPRAMIYTSSQLLDRGGPYGGNKDYPKLGEGNDAYENFVENMTIETGQGNAGAIAIDYLASNLGALRNLNIVAEKGGALTGISMLRKWPGPAIVEHVSITGFDVGIDVENYTYCMTLNNIHLEHQRVAGLRNHQNSLAVEALSVVEEGAPAVVNDAPDGLIVLVGGALHGPGSLIRNEGSIVMHGTQVEGFAATAGGIADRKLDGVLDGRKKWTAAESAWTLPVLTAPDVADSVAGRSVSIAQFGAVNGDDHDSSEAFEKAFASGAATIYIPHGDYAIRQPIDVPASVQHVVGMNSTLKLSPGPGMTITDTGMLRAGAGTKPLLIERLALRAGHDAFGVESNGPRDIVLRDIPTTGQYLLLRQRKGGRVFLDNTCCGGLRIAGQAPVVARQYDTEGDGVRIHNDGAPLWILGIKTERQNLVAETVSGGRTEILGGLIYMVIPNPVPSAPMFKLKDAAMTASFNEEAFAPGRNYEIYLSQERKGKKAVVTGRTGYRPRSRGGDGRVVPLLQGAP
ncbi:MAG TPA: glycoside hydrolase family 55 protein [Acidobacteriaceae bacterium]